MFRLWKVMLISLVYKIFLEFIYVFDLSNAFGYYGLTLNMNIYKCIISYIITIIIALISPRNSKRPSTYFYFLISIFITIPLYSYYWLNDKSSTYVIMVFFSMVIIRSILIIPQIKLPKIKISQKYFFMVIILLYCVTYAGIIYKYGLPDVRSLNFVDIYELRSERKISGILGYSVNWLAKAINPFLLLVCIDKKKYITAVFISIFQIVLYAVLGYKAFLLSIIAVLGCAILMKKNKFSGTITLGLITLNILSISNISEKLNTLITFRMIYLPSVIQYWYYDFFSIYPKLHFSEGLIGKLFNIQSPYNIRSYALIGYHYRGFYHTVNSGIFGDAFANGGFYAMLIISIIFSILLLTIDTISKNLPLYFTVSSMMYIIFVFNDTGLLTALFTGGMILMIVLMYIYSGFTNYQQQIKNNIDVLK